MIRRICNFLQKTDRVINKLVLAGERESGDIKKNKDLFRVQ